MAVELGKISLEHLTQVSVVEEPRIAFQSVPGLKGDLAQTMGRASVSVNFHGLFYGPKAGDDLAQLRAAFAENAPIDFFTEAVGQGYFAKVLITRLEVAQKAGYLDQFDYQCSVREYVEPPAPAADTLAGLDAGLKTEAAGFMKDVEGSLGAVSDLTDLVNNLPLNLPVFSDPTTKLKTIGGPFESAVTDTGPLTALSDVAGLF